MDIEEYISSGILELYATEALTPAEKAEVELVAQQYPEVQAEIDLITVTLNQYAQLHAVTPPAHLRNKVLGAIANTPITNNAQENNQLTAMPDPDPNPVISINKANSNANYEASGYKWLVAAAITLLVLSNALSYYFYRNWKDSEQSLAVALSSQQQYSQNYQQVKQQLDQNEQVLALVTNNETKRVLLKGQPKSPDALVNVYWQSSTKQLYLDVKNIPTPPPGKQYQLWALANGKPIDAGLIEALDSRKQLQQMKDVAVAQAFAITLEPLGGSINPTLDQMVAMGQI